MAGELKVLSVGAGFMGTLHARAYEQIEGVQNVGIVTRNYNSSEPLANILGGDVPRFTDFEEALEIALDIVCWQSNRVACGAAGYAADRERTHRRPCA